MPALDELVFKEYTPEVFPNYGKKVNSGPSPYANSINDGPSYIPPQERSKPLVPSGVFKAEYNKYGKDISPLLGVEYNDNVQVADFITAYLDKESSPETRQKAEKIIRDIAIEISRKGVVVFRHQHKLSVQNQKDFINQLGALAGRPKGNGLHIHPRTPAGGILGNDGKIDPDIILISSLVDSPANNPYGKRINGGAWASSGWHTDVSFEPVPASYSALRIVQRPDEASGGDTLYANGYALYERFSKPFQKFLEGLTGTYSQPAFEKLGKDNDFLLYSEPRGAPENTGDNLTASHPIVRTNPVTGWKSLFGVGHHFDHFNELSAIESQKLTEFIQDTLFNSHDLQVRISWTSDNDLVIWDNRSAFHSATRDYRGVRRGVRAVSVGERPYLDAESGVQSEAIYKEIEEKTGALNLGK